MEDLRENERQIVALSFETTDPATLDTFVSTHGDHSRIEVQRYRVSTKVARLATARRFPGQ
ncbi:hypothetical protein A33M_2002 [Rhodovulum sp. PH10]|uniref:hypothetical protein n=1 Tax=Rhodovulum sp. PH10 TaxID=1187851 RepID=UPI00027C2BE9|nr:hypothetical protein [Rhodovulum sp. PH10]EJW12431.1 hypothetical protein A33M_2002 [Rhodovulum sp. PH10]